MWRILVNYGTHTQPIWGVLDVKESEQEARSIARRITIQAKIETRVDNNAGEDPY